MLSNNRFKLTIIFIIILTLSGFLFYEGLRPVLEKTPQTSKTSSQNQQEQIFNSQAATKNTREQTQFKVLRVIDGDTIEIEYMGQLKKLRYIGVDTPETVDPRRPLQCFGKEASNENKHLVAGKTVSLEKDVSETDKFGRLLRYVYIKLDDGTTLFINDYLVREGFAQVNSFPPDVRYQERFVEAQKEARENQRGLWSRCK